MKSLGLLLKMHHRIASKISWVFSKRRRETMGGRPRARVGARKEEF